MLMCTRLQYFVWTILRAKHSKDNENLVRGDDCRLVITYSIILCNSNLRANSEKLLMSKCPM